MFLYFYFFVRTVSAITISDVWGLKRSKSTVSTQNTTPSWERISGTTPPPSKENSSNTCSMKKQLLYLCLYYLYYKSCWSFDLCKKILVHLTKGKLFPFIVYIKTLHDFYKSNVDNMNTKLSVNPIIWPGISPTNQLLHSAAEYSGHTHETKSNYFI